MSEGFDVGKKLVQTCSDLLLSGRSCLLEYTEIFGAGQDSTFYLEQNIPDTFY